MHRQQFLKILFFVTSARLLLAALFPIVADEAYYILWAKNLALGYYDHPPMVAWFLNLVRWADSLFLYRSLTVLTQTLVAYLIATSLGQTESRFLLGVIFLMLPQTFFNFLVSTETTLTLFCFVSCLFLARSIQNRDKALAFASGLAWGCAFLSKYTAGVLALAFAAMLVARRNFPLLFAFVLGAVPAVALNIIWNYQNCWTNIFFNLRRQAHGIWVHPTTLAEFLLMQLYLITPWLAWMAGKFLYQKRRTLDSFERFHVFSFLGALVIMTCIALRNRMGLHWTLCLYPILFLALGRMSSTALRKCYTLTWIWTVLHLIALVLYFTLPVEAFRKFPQYHHHVFFRHPEEFCHLLEGKVSVDWIATDNYGQSSILAFVCKRPVGVAFSFSNHGRHDDLLTDFRRLEGKRWLFLSNTGVQEAELRKYFERVNIVTTQVHETPVFAVTAEGFKYEPYRRDILQKTTELFYSVPWFHVNDRCFFRARY